MQKYSPFRILFTIVLIAACWATLMVFFYPGEEYITTTELDEEEQFEAQMLATQNAIAGAKKIIGIVPGHYGFDSGELCGAAYNFVKESDVNLRIAVMVRDDLLKAGYSVDLMNEFDPQLADYTGLALVTIHADSCSEETQPSGFHVTTIGHNTYPAESKRLKECLADRYRKNTELPYLGNALSFDNPNLYSFDSVNDYTTIAAIHPGYLSGDYHYLSENMDLVAHGIANGIICYVENETIGNTAVSNTSGAASVPASGYEKDSTEYIITLPEPLTHIH